MAILSKDDAVRLIKAPKNAREIIRARQKRIRHKLHTEADTDTLNFGEASTRFLSWIKAILKNDDNYERFRQLFRPPVYTNELVESIFSQFERVFEAQNSYEKISFTDSELENDFAEYRKKLGDFQFWETQGFETFKNSIDNIVVIDLPKLKLDAAGNPQATTKPEPYYYILDIDFLIDIDNIKVKAVSQENGETFYYFKTEYIIFRGEQNLIYVFDDTHYKIFQDLDNKGAITFVGEAAHDLGFCPARSFWTTPLNSHCTIQKRSPITNSLSEMDWLLFLSLAEKYMQEYVPYPIFAVYKGKCDYKIEINKRKGKCVDGYMEWDGQIGTGENRERCHKCGNKIKVGPGNIIELRVPKDKEDPDLMANPMKIISASTESLEYMKKAVKDKYDEIFQNCVGRGADAKTDQAQNELQIRASFESRTAALIKIKRNFEIIHAFALDTVARLRYGSAYTGIVINYGDEFFVKDEAVLTKELEEAKTSGAPSYEIANRRRAIWESMYRNNPEHLERLIILHNLEPMPDNSIKEVTEMYKALPDLISAHDVAIKLHFNSFIDRFEREQANVNTFARATTFDKKISLIKAELLKYATEYMAVIRPPADPGGVPTPTGTEAEAKAKLKGSVGGVQGILAIQAAVAAGTTDYNSALSLMSEIFGFNDVTAKAILGTPKAPVVLPPAA
jgi:hypothetical protein